MNTFLLIIDSLRAEVERRKNEYINFKEQFLTRICQLLTPKVTEKAQTLVQNYANDLEEHLVQKCVHFYNHV